jgi:hypothetical protein
MVGMELAVLAQFGTPRKGYEPVVNFGDDCFRDFLQKIYSPKNRSLNAVRKANKREI